MFLITNRIKKDFLSACEAMPLGSLRLHTPEGDIYEFGQGSPSATMLIHDWAAISATAARGDVGLGQAYIDRLWDTPSISDLGTLALSNIAHFRGYAYANFWQALKFRIADHLLRPSAFGAAIGAHRYHYDAGNEFFQLWLDDSMSYSCALFDQDGLDLTLAQDRKHDRILDSLGNGSRLLDIGCGWGSFADRAAERGLDVTGITTSANQLGYADARLDGRAEILRQDYRKIEGQFDNIVSIEMLETLGHRHWPSYFATLKARLAKGGRALLQAITIPDDYLKTYLRGTDFVRQHTFPAGALLSRAEIVRQAKIAGLELVDSFAFAPSYAKTCKIWQDRLETNSDRISKMGFDARFQRGWQFYLGTGSAAFAAGHTNVLHLKLAHA